MTIKLEIVGDNASELLHELRVLVHAVDAVLAANANDAAKVYGPPDSAEVDAEEAETEKRKAVSDKVAKAAEEKAAKKAAEAAAKKAAEKAAKEKLAAEKAEAELLGEDEESLTKEQVKAALGAYLKRHSEADTRALLAKHGQGAPNVSALSKAHYDAVFKAATADLQ